VLADPVGTSSSSLAGPGSLTAALVTNWRIGERERCDCAP
jgi:hypothetical protein